MGTKNEISDELLDQLLGGAKTQEELFGPSGVIKKLTGALVERALKAELADHLDQDALEGIPNRRNGSSEKTLYTEHGPTPIDVPRDREARFEPQLVPKYATRVDGLDEKILALYSRGMSTRDIQAELSTLYGADISPALVSRVTEAVRDEISEWQSRPLDRTYLVVWLDALFVKMRETGVVQSRAVHVAVGLTRDGKKEILGLWVETNEGAKFWMRVLSEIQARGVEDILVACCDGLKGFPAAIQAVFPKALVQSCIVHQIRHSLSFVPWRDRKKVADALREIYTADSEATARDRLAGFEVDWGARFPMIVKSWRTNWDQLTSFLAFPLEVRRLIYTTNTIESLNSQLRKVIKTKNAFPSEEAAIKLIYLAVMNIGYRGVQSAYAWSSALAQLVVFFGEDRVLR